MVTFTEQSEYMVSEYKKIFTNLEYESLDLIDLQIRRPGIPVEIDENNLRENKYHRGYPVKREWVLMRVERIPERKTFLAEVPDKTEATFLLIIRTHVLSGQIAITVFFQGYCNLKIISTIKR
ncbi:hypothetical protein HZS_3268 [Henneguya salminicola]|nr:hypothetical protein HZS_3268 [Henneguya salminicola]